MAELKNKKTDDIKNDKTEEAAEVHVNLMEDKFNELVNMLDTKHYSDFIHSVEQLNPVDAADFFEFLPMQRIPAVFKLLKKDTAADVFAELDSDLQKKIITAMTDREISSIMEDLFVDDAVDILSELPANIVHRIMKNTTSETRAEINRFLSYPEDSAGSVMTAEFIDLRANMTCAQAIEHIRRTGVDKETVYTAYVTDESRILKGTVSFKDLLFSSPEETVSEIMDDGLIFAYTLDDKETVAQTISKYDLLALPVVDKEKRLVGIVTVDDALDVIKEETTEDIEKMAAIVPTDKPYMKTGVFETWKKRIPWLLLLMISAVFTSTIITHYENAIGTYAILTAFFPMLMDTGGNAGSQSSVTIIRGLSLDEIQTKDFFRVLWKEFRVSILCGVCIFAACFIKTILVDFRLQTTTLLDNGTVQNNIVIALIISITAFFAVVFAKIIGTILPIGAKRIGLDPAVMASPFITTIVDTVTLIIYFTIASHVLHF